MRSSSRPLSGLGDFDAMMANLIEGDFDVERERGPKARSAEDGRICGGNTMPYRLRSAGRMTRTSPIPSFVRPNPSDREDSDSTERFSLLRVSPNVFEDLRKGSPVSTMSMNSEHSAFSQRHRMSSHDSSHRDELDRRLPSNSPESAFRSVSSLQPMSNDRRTPSLSPPVLQPEVSHANEANRIYIHEMDQLMFDIHRARTELQEQMKIERQKLEAGRRPPPPNEVSDEPYLHRDLHGRAGMPNNGDRCPPQTPAIFGMQSTEPGRGVAWRESSVAGIETIFPARSGDRRSQPRAVDGQFSDIRLGLYY